MSENIIHVTVTGGTEDDMKEIRRFMEDALEDYDGHGKIIVSDENLEITELPSLDDYADELAERVAERVNGE